MTLERIEIPLPPSYGELAAAIVRFEMEIRGLDIAGDQLNVSDLVLLALAERLAASKGQDAAPVLAGVDSGAAGGAGGL